VLLCMLLLFGAFALSGSVKRIVGQWSDEVGGESDF
jgi:hypothetical protein